MIRKYAIKRLLWSLFVLFGLSIIIFIISRIVPGDPARMALGPRVSEEIVNNFREELYLDKPIFIQYIYWFKNAIRGDFGISLMTRRPIIEDIIEFAPATFELIFTAGLIHIIFGLFLGIISALYNNKFADKLIRFIAYIGVATPAFVMAVFLLIIFGYYIPFLPTIGGRISPDIYLDTITGFHIVDAIITGNFLAFKDTLAHLIPPAFSLAIGCMMQEARITRSNMIDNLNKDYILMIRSQGVPERTIITKFLLKPSIIPTVSIIGLDFASLFGNAFLVELIFNWPGLSRYGINAMLRKDLNSITAVVLIIGLIFLISNIIVDLVVSYLDPRVIEN